MHRTGRCMHAFTQPAGGSFSFSFLSMLHVLRPSLCQDMGWIPSFVCWKTLGGFGTCIGADGGEGVCFSAAWSAAYGWE